MMLYSVVIIFSVIFIITWNPILSFFASFLAFNVLGGWKYSKTLPRDLSTIRVFIHLKLIISRYEKANLTIIECFEKTAKKFPTKAMFNFEGQTQTFSLVNEQAEKIASFFQSVGVKKGDCVALFMENSPDLVSFWLGCAKIGAVSSLINFNLREKSLTHSINTCKPKLLVVASSFAPDIAHILESLEISGKKNSIYVHDEGFKKLQGSDLGPRGDVFSDEFEGFENISEKLVSQTGGYIRPKLHLSDLLMYIYTSGTTGLPKAAKITNYRFMNMAVGVGYLNKITKDDVLWTPLPLYHSNAGILAVGQAIYNGATVAFRRKFSASRFWNDITESKATCFNYLGEILRYIYKQPYNPCEEKHQLRTIFGNGLKQQLWLDIKSRYKIPHICEIYGSTEGNCNLVNFDETPGACGFLSIIFPKDIVGIYLMKCDDEGNLIRDWRGLCVQSQPGEQGLVVGSIKESDPTRRFDGYLGENETNKKVARNVKKRGDQAFVSGDILYMDQLGYVYFKDRTGDTFRWKGENVSTCEVESALASSVEHRDVIVYGVEIPGTDGRAGMAAIGNEDGHVDMCRVSRAALSLPSYARPIFVRLLRTSADSHMTGTFKLRKVELQKEGFDLEKVHDPIWFWKAKESKYELMSFDTYTNIIQANISL